MNDINHISLSGVIGLPVAHSRSPQLHNYWLGKYGIRGHYVPLNVKHGDLENAIRTLPKLGFVGINVTIPHKEAVLWLADLVTDRAALIGAANTLIFRSDGKLHADNTDGYGFVENLRQNAPNWHPESGPTAVLGSGGAARAVVASLVEIGVPEIRISNRTRARANALRSEFGARVKVFEWLHAGKMMAGAKLVVNATSLGMEGRPEFQVPLSALSPDTIVNDLVYTPLKTPLLRYAEKLGCVTVDGLGMLLHQAAPAFERWFNIRPDVDEETRRVLLQ